MAFGKRKITKDYTTRVVRMHATCMKDLENFKHNE